MVTLRYFARLKTIIGQAKEIRSLPDDLDTITDLIIWLRKQGDHYARAFADLKTIRAARDHAHVPLDAKIDGAVEIAFFPPVTGG